MKYAYVRVSSVGQNIARQYEEMIKLGIDKKNIYIDKKSGLDFERENYIRLLKKLKEDDILYIKSIDRLGRNYNLIIEEWRKITKNIKAKIYVIDMPLLNTNISDNLISSFISDVILQILSFVAENERNAIKQRQKEGIILAKEKGIKFGRPTKYDNKSLKIINNYKNEIIDIDDAIKDLNVSKSTFYRWLKISDSI